MAERVHLLGYGLRSQPPLAAFAQEGVVAIDRQD
jgi:hypothetical protein